MIDYRAILEGAIAAAREAGALFRAEFHRPEGPRAIDREVEEVLRERLLAVAGWSSRGEELGEQDNGDGAHLWLVDPLDGTDAFERGERGPAVAIAALRDGVPVLGVVYAFAHPDDEGDLIAWAEGCGPIVRNGKPIATPLVDADLDDPSLPWAPHAVVYLPPSAEQAPELTTTRMAPARYVAMPSIAYRLALVAVGEGVATLSFASPVGWDYAAGHALLRAAGGVFVHADGQPVTYTLDGWSATTACFGGAPNAVAALRQRPWATPVPSHEPPPAFPLVRPARYAPARLAPGKAIADAGLLARAQGCLLGQFAGDALGGLVEFSTAAAIRARYPDGCRELADGGTWHNLAGQPTDDSEMALMLARTLVQAGAYVPGAVLEAYVDWYRDPETYDCGGTVAQALRAAGEVEERPRRLLQVEQHASRESQANGSLMRISPLGIFAAGQPAQAAEWARAESRLTHPHPVCQSCCAAFVTALATAIGRRAGARECHEAALACARGSFAPAPVVQALLDAATAPPANYHHQQGWVLIALQNAFYQLLRAPTFEEGVVATVMAGGDTDTNGAIAGALLGAVHGRAAVPANWARAVRCCRALPGTPTHHPRAREYWPVDVLELAERLLLAGQSGS